MAVQMTISAAVAGVLQKGQTSVINTISPVENFIGGVIDDRWVFSPVSLILVRNNQKSLKFIAGVNDTAEKLFTGVRHHR